MTHTSPETPGHSQASRWLRGDRPVVELYVDPAGFSGPACRGTVGGRRKAVRDRLALQGGTGGLSSQKPPDQNGGVRTELYV